MPHGLIRSGSVWLVTSVVSRKPTTVGSAEPEPEPEPEPSPGLTTTTSSLLSSHADTRTAVAKTPSSMEKRITIGIPPAKKDSRRGLVQRSRQRSASHPFEWFAAKPLDQAAFRGDAK